MQRAYEHITQRILAQLREGTIPWRQPWLSAVPKNLFSDREYRGVNALVLGTSGYAAPYWVTFRQAKERGGFVRKGEHGLPCIYWSRREDKNDGRRSYAFLRTYTVFNVEQCEGVAYPKPPRTAASIDACERLVATMPTPPQIVTGAIAAYLPLEDRLEMPPLERFESGEEYFSTLYHELIHATGHETRLGRAFGRDGTAAYAREELIAEVGAAFLCGQAGIANRTVENSSAYIATWLRRLEDDRRLVVQAASEAQRAADYILGRASGA